MRLHELYEDAQHAYIIMENCKGGDLETMLEVSGLFTPPSLHSPAFGFCSVALTWSAVSQLHLLAPSGATAAQQSAFVCRLHI